MWEMLRRRNYGGSGEIPVIGFSDVRKYKPIICHAKQKSEDKINY